MTPPTGLVVALWSEARPLIDTFGLRESARAAPFRLYRGDDVSLVVSTVGKTAAAAATGYLFAAEGDLRDRAWINVGIAGHGRRPVGEGLVAAKIEDAGSGRVWYPCPVFTPPSPLGVVRTVERAEERYEGDTAFDMEASGFFATASRFATAELVQVYKIVSDGPGVDLRSLTAARVSELVAAHREPIGRLVAATAELAAELERARPEVDVDPWVERWRFTVTQRRRLEKLLARLAVFTAPPPAPEELEAGDAGAVLDRLSTRLRRAAESHEARGREE